MARATMVLRRLAPAVAVTASCALVRCEGMTPTTTTKAEELPTQQQQQQRLARLSQEKNDATVPQQKRRGSVFEAVVKRDVAALRRCLEADASHVNARNAQGLTPLLIAARAKDGHELVEVLLRKGASVDKTDPLGRTPLHGACLGGDAKTTQLLLAAGADAHAKEKRRGATPLHFACAFARTDALETFFLNANPKKLVEARDSSARTPLHWSALSAHRDFAKDEALRVAAVLLDNGADCRARDKTGATPAHTAAHLGATRFLAFLAHRNDTDPKVRSDEDRKLAVLLQQHKKPPRGLLHQIDNRGHTPLDIALALYDTSRFRFFLDWLSPPQWTGLHAAHLGLALPRHLPSFWSDDAPPK